VRIYPRNVPAVGAHSVDISESGISAMLRDEVSLGEVVCLAFTIPTGDVPIHALVRQRNTVGRGFKFLEAVTQSEIIARACGQPAMSLTRPRFARREIPRCIGFRPKTYPLPKG